MTEPLWVDEPRTLWKELCRLVAERAPAEVEIPRTHAERRQAAEAEYQAAEARITQQHQQDRQAAESLCAGTRRDIVQRCEEEHRRAEEEYEHVRRRAVTQWRLGHKKAKKAHQEARWEATTVYEATKNGPPIRLKQTQEAVAARQGELQSTSRRAVAVLQRRWQWRDYPEPEVADPPADADPVQHFQALVLRAREQLTALAGQRTAALFEGGKPAGLLLLFWVLAVIPCGFTLGWNNWLWVAASVVVALGLWGGLGIWLFRKAKRQCERAYLALRKTLLEADLAARHVLTTAEETCRRESQAILDRFRTDTQRADDLLASTTADTDRRKETTLKEADEKYPALLTEIVAGRERELERVEAEHLARLDEIDRTFQQESDRLYQEHARTMAEIDACYHQQWDAMASAWHDGLQGVRSGVDGLAETCGRLFFRWEDAGSGDWRQPAEIPPAMPFGRLTMDLARMEGGLPQDERLAPAQSRFELPGLMPFPDRCLVMEASGEGRDRAIETLQAMMLRMLTSVPPGKVKFTIIDPVGLGENFSAFMHLSDYDEGLVSSRIWTEPGHIEQRLADLTEHMETVLQVYLRNEFDTIRQYNDFAGEMAEAYRVLVVANFPAGFTEAAARRLLSIAASGARCGVHVLLTVDTKLQLPHNFHLSDLRPHSVRLVWRKDRFAWDDAELKDLPLELPRPPEAGPFTEIVRAVGSVLEDADRVEVPFENIVPDDSRWWTSTSREGIDVPLGRAGAKKLQHLTLGRGTSQHVLIAGKTGSGKSTLLHAMITSVAMRYSPDEVELYLVDFKKGVEFKAYAAHELPHARVVAIESEREFGVSVLERLDAELKERGDLFRRLGVQDVAGFRAARPDERMPRVLLVIDEFQELFTEDDRLAQDAALLLDRLVRQGRAFGIHVMLGSQTLAGAYSLPRATIGQMAVRIALQCSEADAHLILSEENTAARLLTRPGEAIYNDANGLYEGNHPFQIVWLPDDKREQYLGRIRSLAEAAERLRRPAIVFEGNVPADLTRNGELAELLAAGAWPEPSRQAKAWLGAAVAIKEPTVAVFERHGGSNLLLVGHREEEALGVLAASMLSLAAQCPPAGADGQPAVATFCLLDGTRPDAPEAGFWERLGGVLPHQVRVADPRDAAAVVGELAEEVARRQEAGEEDAPPVYLIVYNLGRFRDLRKAEDDFSFSLDDDKPASAGKQFGTILSEGPALGVHTLVWCDSYNALSRSLDRQAVRELEMRVVFQMNASDSSNLIDTADAARLGVHRAILASEATGVLEKFRPYGPPAQAWLEQIKAQLHGRAAASPT